MNDGIKLSKELKNEITLPVSKSVLHRALICAAFADNKTDLIFQGELPDDIKATVDCLRAVGADIDRTDNGLTVTPFEYVDKNMMPILNVGESATAMRLLIPILSYLFDRSVIHRSGSLINRPAFCDGYVKTEEKGADIIVYGGIGCEKYTVDASATSQTVSGMILAFSMFGGEITAKDPVSQPYIDMTVKVMRDFSVNVEKSGNTYRVPKQRFASPKRYYIGGDCSAEAYICCAELICQKKITVIGSDTSDLQGDRVIKDIIGVYPDPIIYNAKNTPDLVPPLAVLAGFCNGKSVISGVCNLKVKESNRLTALCDMINALGGKADIQNDDLIIYGNGRLSGGTVCAYRDHRIAMSAAIASLGCENDVVLYDAGGPNGENSCVSKSWKGFFDIFV